MNNLINKNLKIQGKSIKGIIKDAFTTEISEVNDVDFFEVINSKLSTYFCLYLSKIIFYTLKENILNQILNTNHFDMIMQNDYFYNIVHTAFEKKTFNFVPPLKMNINANQITIYNGLEIPQSKLNLDKLIKYINEQIYQFLIKFLENYQELINKSFNKINDDKNLYIDIRNFFFDFLLNPALYQQNAKNISLHH